MPTDPKHVHSFGPRGRMICACGMSPEYVGFPLVSEARASGRHVHVITYYDGNTPIRPTLLFKTSEDAERIAEILTKAKRDRG